MRLIQRYLLAGALMAVASGAAIAQPRNNRYPDATGTIPRVAVVPSAVAPEWSGQSGASGDPRMSADAIRLAAANFHDCLERLWPAAARRGVSRETFSAYTTRLTPDLRIMDLLDGQPEFTKSFWDYLDLLVNEERIRQGRALLERYRAIFDAVEKAYGVDRYVIAAIWGVETNYGTLGGERPVVRSTATLACIGRRQNYFREEFLSALEILQRGDVKPERFVGSWAGAFGPTQFMPTAFKRYAVDFDRDGRRDVIDSVPDLIASTANNLKKDGWVAGADLGLRSGGAGEFQFHARRPRPDDDDPRLGAHRAGAASRQVVSASGRKRVPADPGRRAGPRFPDAAEFPRHHAIQSGRSLCVGDRPSFRPAARR